MLLLSKAISAGHAAEETRKQAREILRFQPTADLDENFKRKLIMSNHNICNQSTRDLNFAIVHISEANAQLMEKFVMCALKWTISKFAAPRLGKKEHEIEKEESDEPSNQSDYFF